MHPAEAGPVIDMLALKAAAPRPSARSCARKSIAPAPTGRSRKPSWLPPSAGQQRPFLTRHVRGGLLFVQEGADRTFDLRLPSVAAECVSQGAGEGVAQGAGRRAVSGSCAKIADTEGSVNGTAPNGHAGAAQRDLPHAGHHRSCGSDAAGVLLARYRRRGSCRASAGSLA